MVTLDPTYLTYFPCFELQQYLKSLKCEGTYYFNVEREFVQVQKYKSDCRLFITVQHGRVTVLEITPNCDHYLLDINITSCDHFKDCHNITHEFVDDCEQLEGCLLTILKKM
jgi:hypothetical protein